MSRQLLVSLSLLPLLLVACGPSEAPPPAAQRVENSDLGLAVAKLSAPFEVAANGPEGIVLTAPSELGEARLEITAGAETTSGINLVEEVKARKAAFEALPGGIYNGNRELGTPFGPAYTARGSYPEGDGRVEETWVYTLHPGANRLLTLVYRYPPQESQERVNQLLLVLGEIEPLSPSG